MTELTRKNKNRLTIIAIFTLFLAPVLLSWWFLNYSEHVRSGEKSNHGNLITPARSLPEIMLENPGSPDKTRSLHGRWSLVYLMPADCNEPCKKKLYSLNQIEQMLGKDSLRVQRVVVVDNVATSRQVLHQYPGQWLLKLAGPDGEGLLGKFRLEEADDPFAAGRIYLVDPVGNLIMSYPAGFDPYDLVEDLRLLLKASIIG